jgi:hypothetical protein
MLVGRLVPKEHAMKCSACVGLALAACVLACGCGTADLREYEPVGPSAEFLLPTLGLGFNPYFVLGPNDPPLTVLNLTACYTREVLEPRSATEGFRILCALVNRYFGNWERLVVIERLERGGWVATGFIAVAVAGEATTGVTNLGPQGPDAGQWTATTHPRVFEVQRAKFESCLLELNKARKGISRRPFLWYSNKDWPVYFLHDIKLNHKPARDEWPLSCFSFAFCGWAVLPESEKLRLLKAPRDYPRAHEALCRYRTWQEYDVGSAADKELRDAGTTYASLLNFVWESTLAKPDYGVLGVDPLARPPADESVMKLREFP